MAKQTFTIPEQNWERFVDTIESLNKRAVKLGLAENKHTPIRFTIQREYQEKTDRFGIVSFKEITISGASPKLDGWTFVASKDHQTGMVNVSPSWSDENEDENIPHWFMTAGPDCHHCGYTRLRNKTFLVVSEGEYKQVGSTCLRDFTGWANAESIASMMETLWEKLDLFHQPDFCYGLDSKNREFALRPFLALTSRIIKEHGWVSKGAVRNGYADQATVSLVMSIIDNRENWSEIEESDDDYELADRVIEWALKIDRHDPKISPYLFNLSVIAEAGGIVWKQFGIAASMIAAYWRDNEMQAIRDRKKESEHVGTVGERQTFQNLTVEAIKYLEYQYSWHKATTITLYKFRDPAGNLIVWFSSSRKIELEEGITYDITGTVKEHDVYKGERQTVLTRCKAKEIKEAQSELE